MKKRKITALLMSLVMVCSLTAGGGHHVMDISCWKLGRRCYG